MLYYYQRFEAGDRAMLTACMETSDQFVAARILAVIKLGGLAGLDPSLWGLEHACICW
jgi:hypothetical protein